MRPRVARATIATIPIALTPLVVPARFFGLGGLEPIRKHGLCLVRAEQKGVLVLDIILGRFHGGAVAPEAASIRLMDRQRMVQGGLGFGHDSLLDGLVPGVFSTTFFLGLGTDGWP